MNDMSGGVPGNPGPRDPEPVGAYGIIVPALHYQRCFALNPDFAPEAAQVLANLKREVGGRYVPPSAVLEPVAGVVDADQPWVGVLSAGLVDQAVASRQAGMDVLALVLHQVTGFRHFLIVGTVHPSGTRTSIQHLSDARSIDDVRAAVENHPEIVKDKLVRHLDQIFRSFR